MTKPETYTPVADSEYPWWISAAPDWAQPYMLLARLDRPIGTWLLLLPCWWGAALGALHEGDGLPNIWHMVLFSLGAIIMRGAGCAFNDIIDKEIDAKVERTRARPLAAGAVSEMQAGLFVIGLSLLGFVILLQFNALTVWIGIGALGLVAAYPFMKRITWWPQAWLGLTFNWGALVGYAAASNELNIAAFVLYAAGIAWTLGYDTIYACQDVEDDALVGVRSTARLFGADVAHWVKTFYAISAVLLITAVSLEEGDGFFALFALSGACTHLLWQARQLAKPAPDYLKLFRANRSFGLYVTFALICSATFAN